MEPNTSPATPAQTPSVNTKPEVHVSPGVATMRRLLRKPTFVIGSVVCLMFVLMAVFSPLIAPYDPAAISTGPALAPPSGSHLMGTDDFGRDVFSRVVFGSRLSLSVGVGSVIISTLAGAAIGVLAGFNRGRWIDSILMRVMDVLLAFPGLLLALTVAAVMGPGIVSVILAVGVRGIPNIARVVRSTAISVSEQDYIMAARSNGCTNFRIMKSYVLPNSMGEIIVMSTLYLAISVLIAASLSFLGVGVPPPSPEWGGMTSAGRGVLAVAWWVSTFPGLMIVLFVLAVNLMGDALRDALDRTLRHT